MIKGIESLLDNDRLQMRTPGDKEHEIATFTDRVKSTHPHCLSGSFPVHFLKATRGLLNKNLFIQMQ